MGAAQAAERLPSPQAVAIMPKTPGVPLAGAQSVWAGVNCEPTPIEAYLAANQSKAALSVRYGCRLWSQWVWVGLGRGVIAPGLCFTLKLSGGVELEGWTLLDREVIPGTGQCPLKLRESVQAQADIKQ